MNVKVLVAKSCPTLCDPMDYSPPGSSIHGIVQARVREWGAIAYSGYHLYVESYKNDTNELIYKMKLWLPRGTEERGINWEFGIDMYILPYLK